VHIKIEEVMQKSCFKLENLLFLASSKSIPIPNIWDRQAGIFTYYRGSFYAHTVYRRPIGDSSTAFVAVLLSSLRMTRNVVEKAAY
jgi:hypothetical protein